MIAPAQLESAWVADVQFLENDSYVHNGPLTYEIAEDVEVLDFDLDGDENFPPSATLRLALSMRWFADDEESSSGPFNLTMAVCGSFLWEERPDDERIAEKWLEFNGPYLLWPYARAYIQSLTSFSRLAPLTIYTRQVPELPDIVSEEDARPASVQD